MAKKMLEVIAPTAGGTGRTVYINADAIRVVGPLRTRANAELSLITITR